MIWEVNLELGRPSADEALRRLEHELAAKRHLRAKAMKIIHGYGSSGKGGRIRTASRKYLRAAQEQGRIYAVLPGERLTIFDEEARRLMACCPALRDDCDRERYNCGVTFVIF